MARRNLVYSQAILYVTFLISIIVAPVSLSDNGGFSYFGRHRQTVIIFGFGLIASAYFLLKAASFLPKTGYLNAVRYCFLAIALLMAGIVAVPAIGNGLIDLTHRIFGALIFLIELGLACLLVWRARKIRLHWLLLALQISGGLIALVYLSPAQGFELQGQLLFQAAFSVLLLRSLSRPLEEV